MVPLVRLPAYGNCMHVAYLLYASTVGEWRTEAAMELRAMLREPSGERTGRTGTGPGETGRRCRCAVAGGRPRPRAAKRGSQSEKFHSSYLMSRYTNNTMRRANCTAGRRPFRFHSLKRPHPIHSRSPIAADETETSATRTRGSLLARAAQRTASAEGGSSPVRPRHRKLRRGSTTASRRRSSSCAWRLHLEQPGQKRDQPSARLPKARAVGAAL